jgi:hypothetical protein
VYFPEQLSAVSSSDSGTYLAGKYISIARIPTFSGREFDIFIYFNLSVAKSLLARVYSAHLMTHMFTSHYSQLWEDSISSSNFENVVG